MECEEKARLVEVHHKAAIAYSRAARALARKRSNPARKLLLGSRNVPSGPELGMARMGERWAVCQQVTTRAIIAADEGCDHAPNFNPEGRVA